MWGHSPLGAHPHKCGVQLRRWEYQRRLSSSVMIRRMLRACLTIIWSVSLLQPAVTYLPSTAAAACCRWMTASMAWLDERLAWTFEPAFRAIMLLSWWTAATAPTSLMCMSILSSKLSQCKWLSLHRHRCVSLPHLFFMLIYRIMAPMLILVSWQSAHR